MENDPEAPKTDNDAVEAVPEKTEADTPQTDDQDEFKQKLENFRNFSKLESKQKSITPVEPTQANLPVLSHKETIKTDAEAVQTDIADASPAKTLTKKTFNAADVPQTDAPGKTNIELLNTDSPGQSKKSSVSPIEPPKANLAPGFGGGMMLMSTPGQLPAFSKKRDSKISFRSCENGH